MLLAVGRGAADFYNHSVDPRLLDGLSEDDRRRFLAKMPRRSFRKGDTLFFEGDPGESIHFLVRGTVAVRVSTPQGDVATLTVLGPGSTFGELALISPDAQRTATVVALEAAESRMLHRRDFDALRSDHPHIERLLISILAGQVQRLSNQVVEALYTPADRRVVRRVAELAELFDRGGDRVEVPIRQEDLASMAGTTRPTANRVLKALEQAGVILLTRGRLQVLDRAGLNQRARL